MKKDKASMRQVDVQVESGVVTVSGVVPNGMTMHAVCDAAQATPGVVDVINDMAVGKSG